MYGNPHARLPTQPDQQQEITNTFSNPLIEFERPYGLETEKPESISISLSDLEPQPPTENLSNEEVVSAMKGVSGHTIASLTYDVMYQIRKLGRVSRLLSTDLTVTNGQRKILDSVYFDDSWFSSLNLEQTVYFASDVWSNLRNKMTFTRRRANATRRPTIEGWQYKADEVRDMWNSDELMRFENGLFELLQTRVSKFGSTTDEEDRWLYLPIESDPRFTPQHEKLYVTHIHLPPYSFQIKARADCVIESPHATLCIDHKFGNPNSLATPAHNAQALLYSFLTQNRRQISFARIQDIQLPPQQSFFYHSYDSYKGEDTYIDPTSNFGLTDALSYLNNRLYEIMFDEKNFREAKRRKATAIVMPHLPSDCEEKTAFQPRLF